MSVLEPWVLLGPTPRCPTFDYTEKLSPTVISRPDPQKLCLRAGIRGQDQGPEIEPGMPSIIPSGSRGLPVDCENPGDTYGNFTDSLPQPAGAICTVRGLTDVGLLAQHLSQVQTILHYLPLKSRCPRPIPGPRDGRKSPPNYRDGPGMIAMCCKLHF